MARSRIAVSPQPNATGNASRHLIPHLPQMGRWFAREGPSVAMPASDHGCATDVTDRRREDRGKISAKLAPVALEGALTLPPPKAIQK
jgi:hypothetical protein